MKINQPLKLFVAIVGVQLVGVIGAGFTTSSIDSWYSGLIKSSLNPPNWIFGPVWITLYLIMAFSAYMVWVNGIENNRVRLALGFFIFQLVLNSLWSVVFFGAENPGGAIFVIGALWLSIVATMFTFARVSMLAMWLLLPYWLWVSFAVYLNFSIWILN